MSEDRKRRGSNLASSDPSSHARTSVIRLMHAASSAAISSSRRPTSARFDASEARTQSRAPAECDASERERPCGDGTVHALRRYRWTARADAWPPPARTSAVDGIQVSQSELSADTTAG